MAEAKSLKDLMRIRAHNRKFLDEVNGTLGTALGYKKPTNSPITKQPAVIVFVPQKIHPKWLPKARQLPKELKGPDGLWCALDVVEGGKAEAETPVAQAYDELTERLRGWDEQIWAGSQISHWVDESKGSYSMGTLGAFVRRKHDKALGLLTNQHVGIKPTQKLYHPVPWGTHLATTEQVLEYVQDQDWYGTLVDEPNTSVRVDCAFARLTPQFPLTDIEPDLLGIGPVGSVKPIQLDSMFPVGEKVLRVGRTTGLRKGTVVAFGYEFHDEANIATYTDLLIVGDDNIPFSTHGDSGSLIVTDDKEHRALGLLWGGWQEKLRTGYAQENWTYAIALSRVLEALALDLVQKV